MAEATTETSVVDDFKPRSGFFIKLKNRIKKTTHLFIVRLDHNTVQTFPGQDILICILEGLQISTFFFDIPDTWTPDFIGLKTVGQVLSLYLDVIDDPALLTFDIVTFALFLMVLFSYIAISIFAYYREYRKSPESRNLYLTLSYMHYLISSVLFIPIARGLLHSWACKGLFSYCKAVAVASTSLYSIFIILVSLMTVSLFNIDYNHDKPRAGIGSILNLYKRLVISLLSVIYFIPNIFDSNVTEKWVKLATLSLLLPILVIQIYIQPTYNRMTGMCESVMSGIHCWIWLCLIPVILMSETNIVYIFYMGLPVVILVINMLYERRAIKLLLTPINKLRTVSDIELYVRLRYQALLSNSNLNEKTEEFTQEITKLKCVYMAGIEHLPRSSLLRLFQGNFVYCSEPQVSVYLVIKALLKAEELGPSMWSRLVINKIRCSYISSRSKISVASSLITIDNLRSTLHTYETSVCLALRDFWDEVNCKKPDIERMMLRCRDALINLRVAINSYSENIDTVRLNSSIRQQCSAFYRDLVRDPDMVQELIDMEARNKNAQAGNSANGGYEEDCENGIVVINGSENTGEIQSINAKGCQVLSASLHLMVGRSIDIIVPEPLRPHHLSYIQRYLNLGSATFLAKQLYLLVVNANGQLATISATVHTYNPNMESLQFIALFNEVHTTYDHFFIDPTGNLREHTKGLAQYFNLESSDERHFEEVFKEKHTVSFLQSLLSASSLQRFESLKCEAILTSVISDATERVSLLIEPIEPFTLESPPKAPRAARWLHVLLKFPCYCESPNDNAPPTLFANSTPHYLSPGALALVNSSLPLLPPKNENDTIHEDICSSSQSSEESSDEASEVSESELSETFDDDSESHLRVANYVDDQDQQNDSNTVMVSLEAKLRKLRGQLFYEKRPDNTQLIFRRVLWLIILCILALTAGYISLLSIVLEALQSGSELANKQSHQEVEALSVMVALESELISEMYFAGLEFFANANVSDNDNEDYYRYQETLRRMQNSEFIPESLNSLYKVRNKVKSHENRKLVSTKSGSSRLKLIQRLMKFDVNDKYKQFIDLFENGEIGMQEAELLLNASNLTVEKIKNSIQLKNVNNGDELNMWEFKENNSEYKSNKEKEPLSKDSSKDLILNRVPIPKKNDRQNSESQQNNINDFINTIDQEFSPETSISTDDIIGVDHIIDLQNIPTSMKNIHILNLYDHSDNSVKKKLVRSNSGNFNCDSNFDEQVNLNIGSDIGGSISFNCNVSSKGAICESKNISIVILNLKNISQLKTQWRLSPHQYKNISSTTSLLKNLDSKHRCYFYLSINKGTYNMRIVDSICTPQTNLGRLQIRYSKSKEKITFLSK